MRRPEIALVVSSAVHARHDVVSDGRIAQVVERAAADPADLGSTFRAATLHADWAWQASRVDVAEGTMQTYTVALNRLLPRLGDAPADQLDAAGVAALVAELHAEGCASKRSGRRSACLRWCSTTRASSPIPRATG
jgi:hypothetical protein